MNALLMTALILFAVAPAVALTSPALQVSTATIRSGDTTIVMTDTLYADGRLDRRYQQGATLLYLSNVRSTTGGFSTEVVTGHPAQLGSFTIEQGTLEVKDPRGTILWTEKLTLPMCLPELSAEFVRAHWDVLSVGAAPVKCVVPIIKAKKVAPVQWVRLPDTEAGLRVVELQPGSFGMRFFLSPTRLSFSADGTRLLAQSGQFETTKDPKSSPSYLKGDAVMDTPRQAALWPKERFGTLPGSP